MIADLEKFVEFCVKDAMISVRDSFSIDLSSAEGTIVRDISENYGISIQKASKLFSPIFWSITLKHYEEFIPNDRLMHPAKSYKLSYVPPLTSEGNQGWRIAKEYHFFDESHVKNICGYTIKLYGDYLSYLLNNPQ